MVGLNDVRHAFRQAGKNAQGRPVTFTDSQRNMDQPLTIRDAEYRRIPLQ